MDETEKTSLPKQVCTIRIIFPVDTDEQAISYKKKIGDVLADIPNIQIQFSLMSPSAMLSNPRP